jgi:hypothetical protein
VLLPSKRLNTQGVHAIDVLGRTKSSDQSRHCSLEEPVLKGSSRTARSARRSAQRGGKDRGLERIMADKKRVNPKPIQASRRTAEAARVGSPNPVLQIYKSRIDNRSFRWG